MKAYYYDTAVRESKTGAGDHDTGGLRTTLETLPILPALFKFQAMPSQLTMT